LRSRRTKAFRRLLDRLPGDARDQAQAAYRLFASDPFHESLHFKRAARYDDIYSARVGMSHRVLGVRRGDLITWYWIGTHAEYDQVLRRH